MRCSAFLHATVQPLVFFQTVEVMGGILHGAPAMQQMWVTPHPAGQRTRAGPLCVARGFGVGGFVGGFDGAGRRARVARTDTDGDGLGVGITLTTAETAERDAAGAATGPTWVQPVRATAVRMASMPRDLMPLTILCPRRCGDHQNGWRSIIRTMPLTARTPGRDGGCNGRGFAWI